MDKHEVVEPGVNLSDPDGDLYGYCPVCSAPLRRYFLMDDDGYAELGVACSNDDCGKG